MRGLVWFKADLRVEDNTALAHAAAHCEDGIAGIYIVDATMWKKHDVASCRVDFEIQGLSCLRTELEKSNIPLIVLSCQNTAAIPQLMLEVIEKNQFSAFFYNRQYELNELRRDEAVASLLEKHRIEIHSYEDQVILPTQSVKTQQKTFYSVFTPYKHAWKNVFVERGIKTLRVTKNQTPLALQTPLGKIPDVSANALTNIWPAGPAAAKKRLNYFIKNTLDKYHLQRDFPAIDGTSKLSPYLAAGMISPRQCLFAALDANEHELHSGNPGALKWIDELIWREFYKQILVTAPRVSMNKAYKAETDEIWWDYDANLFAAWKNGETGYPIIDAAMRQLKQIGWMHNRLRMVVSMFLTKNLFFDWRLGEKYFMQQLIDGDLAANNGGWQWSASTGTDSAPYFRILNPVKQSERYDPEAKFIVQYCPELKNVDLKKIHNPQGVNYIKPIIGLNEKRLKVLQAFKNKSRGALAKK